MNQKDLGADDALASAPLTDFNRPVHCLLGIPFDAITQAEAVRKVRKAIVGRHPRLLVTPNTNFVVEARKRPEFRNVLLKADLSTVDGMPLVWLARLAGLPISERVSGADLFEALRQPEPEFDSVGVFYFGGPDGAAAAAHEQTNAVNDNLHSVGALSPGFGSISELSDPEHLKRINESSADLLVIALGAVRGHAWIEHNLGALRVPLICHLGAVLNFAANRIRRAPRWIGSSGLEWLWRICQEPHLASRYGRDFMSLAYLIFARVLPNRLLTALPARRPQNSGPAIEFAVQPIGVVLTLRGSHVSGGLQPLRDALDRAARQSTHVVLDLAGAHEIDSAGVGLLLLLKGHCLRIGRTLVIRAVSNRVRRILRYHCADHLLAAPSDTAPEQPAEIDVSLSAQH